MVMSRYVLKGSNPCASERKAQSSVEFLLIFIFLLIALLVMSLITFQKSSNILSEQKDYEANEFLREVADKINMVFIEGDGFCMNITLPDTVLEYEYSFLLEGNKLRLSVFGKVYEKPLATKDVVGINNLNSKGMHKLQNKGGTVLIGG